MLDTINKLERESISGGWKNIKITFQNNWENLNSKIYGYKEKEKFIKSAQQLNLGQHFDGLSMIEDHLWRRYGSEAFTILDLIKDDQSLANEVHPGSGYIKAEFVYMAKFEQITCLEDVLRRRTTLAMEYKEEEMD